MALLSPTLRGSWREVGVEEVPKEPPMGVEGRPTNNPLWSMEGEVVRDGP